MPSPLKAKILKWAVATGTKHRGEVLVGARPGGLAYALADTAADPALARQYAEKAVSMIEEESAKVTLSGLQNENLQRVTLLAAAWDTLGWAYFKLGDLERRTAM